MEMSSEVVSRRHLGCTAPSTASSSGSQLAARSGSQAGSPPLPAAAAAPPPRPVVSHPSSRASCVGATSWE